MKTAFEIVRSVFAHHKGLPDRLAGMTGKSDEWYRSHGREPKTRNPFASGNASPVTAYMEYCLLYEGGSRGAGAALNNRVHAALSGEFAETDMFEVSQADLETEVLDQNCDVHKWLAQHDLEKAGSLELEDFDRELGEAMEALLGARARTRLLISRLKNLKPNLAAVSK